MATHQFARSVKRGTPQHRLMLMIRERGSITVTDMLQSHIYAINYSGAWVGKLQLLIDRGVLSRTDNERQVTLPCVGANDRPGALRITLTTQGHAQLDRIDAKTAPAQDQTAPAAVTPPPYRCSDHRSAPNPAALRPPVHRPGALDFVRCPSVIGDRLIDYTPTC